jgi:hypothetical protein
MFPAPTTETVSIDGFISSPGHSPMISKEQCTTFHVRISTILDGFFKKLGCGVALYPSSLQRTAGPDTGLRHPYR